MREGALTLRPNRTPEPASRARTRPAHSSSCASTMPSGASVYLAIPFCKSHGGRRQPRDLEARRHPFDLLGIDGLSRPPFAVPDDPDPRLRSKWQSTNAPASAAISAAARSRSFGRARRQHARARLGPRLRLVFHYAKKAIQMSAAGLEASLIERTGSLALPLWPGRGIQLQGISIPPAPCGEMRTSYEVFCRYCRSGAEIKDIASTGLLDGVTTNPSLIAKSGRDFKETIKEICAIVPARLCGSGSARVCEMT